MTKSCSKCGLDLPLGEFYKQSNGKFGRRSRCKACYAGEVLAYRRGPGHERHNERNRGYMKQRTPEQWRKYDLAKWGITPEEYDSILESQGGVCAICKGGEPSGRRLAIDHDHACCPERARSCGACIRGLLCSRCNVMVGMALDNPERLLAGVEYLRGVMN